MQLVNAALGVVGEAGELADEIKKRVFHGVNSNDNRIRSELGDALYYIAAIASVMNWSLEVIAEENLAKLKARYPNGFTEGGGIR